MPRILLLLFVTMFLSGCSTDWEPAFDVTVDAGAFERVAIADPADALTFARIESGDGPKVIAVTRYEAGVVEGVDLSVVLGRHIDDPVRPFLEQGYDALRSVVLEERSGARVYIRANELIIPVDLRDHHIAAGTNFPEHAGETSVERGPFMFPKVVSPTGPYSPISAGKGLLDYEVELAWVTLEPVSTPTAPQYMGLIACNDFTDRATLLRTIDMDDIESGEGFTTGKSFPGSLPVGNLFVVPRDFRAFSADLELRLYVNNRLRQRSPAEDMIWNIDELFIQTWARHSLTWQHRGERVSLFGKPDLIPERTLLMSGTPHGTVFRGMDTRQKALGVLAWLSGGWGESIPDQVISAYIDDARSAGSYLQPGDQVTIHIEYLGMIRNEVNH